MNLGTDIKLIDGYELSSTGDVQFISGLQNLKEAIYRRIITNPGEVLHRPKYGVGIRRYANKPSTLSNRQELINAIRMNIRSEKRIEEIQNIICDWSMDTVYITIRVLAFGMSVEFDYKVVKI